MNKNNLLTAFALGVVVGAMFKGLLTIGVILLIIATIAYFYIKRSKLVAIFKRT